jgi:dienelactone hydrolase
MNRILMLIAAALVVTAATSTALLIQTSTSAQDTGEPKPGQVKEYFPNILTRTVAYKDGEAECEAFMAWDENLEGERPCVLIVHDWMGRGAFDEQRARELASMGYIGFSLDIYGKGVRPTNREEASKAAGSWYSNTAGLRARIKAGHDAALQHKMVDSNNVAIMGYCFGGKCALEHARSGAQIVGAISFHGSLGTDMPAKQGDIKGSVLVLHGADDPNVPLDKAVVPLWKEMQGAGCDWQLVAYGNSVHSFTNPAAGNDNSRGAAYNELADRRSWEAMKNFFWEVFE